MVDRSEAGIPPGNPSATPQPGSAPLPPRAPLAADAPPQPLASPPSPADATAPHRPPAEAPFSPLRALRVIIGSTMVSRVLGAVRDMATALVFGLDQTMDALAFALRIPNLSRRLFGEGALATTFLPAFTRVYERGGSQGPAHAWQLASAIFSLLALILSAAVLLGELLLAVLWHEAAPGGKGQLLLGLTAVMLPYAVFICLAAQISAVLQARDRFGWPSVVPVILNVVWLAGLLLAHKLWKGQSSIQAYVVALSVLVAGGLQLALQVPALRALGFRFDRNWGAVWDEVRGIGRAILPVTFGLSITQINSVLDSLVAWVFSRPPTGSGHMPLPGEPLYPLEAGSVSALYFAERVYQFPLGVFGVALGTVLFPLFARHAARHEFDRLRDDLSLSLRLVLVVGLPASVGMWAVADDLVQALLQHGRFDQADATRTAAMIAWYSLGVWAYCAIPVLFRGFYALGDRTTPLRVGMLMVALNLVLNVTLIWVLAERGLALSTAVAAMLQAGLLTWGLQARLGRLDWSVLALTAARCVVACAVMLLVCRWMQGQQPDWERLCTELLPDARRWGRFLGELIRLMVPVGVAGLSYLVVGWLLGMPELKLLLHREPGDAFQSTTQSFD